MKWDEESGVLRHVYASATVYEGDPDGEDAYVRTFDGVQYWAVGFGWTWMEDEQC